VSTPYPTSFDDLNPRGLPTHELEVLSSHEGSPSVVVQNATHGAPAAVPDHGMDDRAKLR
jgi:hypothetical protein